MVWGYLGTYVRGAKEAGWNLSPKDMPTCMKSLNIGQKGYTARRKVLIRATSDGCCPILLAYSIFFLHITVANNYTLTLAHLHSKSSRPVTHSHMVRGLVAVGLEGSPEPSPQEICCQSATEHRLCCWTTLTNRSTLREKPPYRLRQPTRPPNLSDLNFPQRPTQQQLLPAPQESQHIFSHLAKHRWSAMLKAEFL